MYILFILQINKVKRMQLNILLLFDIRGKVEKSSAVWKLTIITGQ